MENRPVIHIMGTQCRPEDEEKFNKWYNDVHIPLLFKFKGIKQVNRYKLITKAGDYSKYLAIYEFENEKAYEAWQTSPELDAAKEERKVSWKEGGIEVKWRVAYEVIKTWKR